MHTVSNAGTRLLLFILVVRPSTAQDDVERCHITLEHVGQKATLVYHLTDDIKETFNAFVIQIYDSDGEQLKGDAAVACTRTNTAPACSYNSNYAFNETLIGNTVTLVIQSISNETVGLFELSVDPVVKIIKCSAAFGDSSTRQPHTTYTQSTGTTLESASRTDGGKDEESSSDNTGVIIGVPVAVVLVAACVIGGVLFVRRQRRERDQMISCNCITCCRAGQGKNTRTVTNQNDEAASPLSGNQPNDSESSIRTKRPAEGADLGGAQAESSGAQAGEQTSSSSGGTSGTLHDQSAQDRFAQNLKMFKQLNQNTLPQPAGQCTPQTARPRASGAGNKKAFIETNKGQDKTTSSRNSDTDETGNTGTSGVV